MMPSVAHRHLVTVLAVVLTVALMGGVPAFAELAKSDADVQLAAGTNNATWVKSGWKNGPVQLPANWGKIAALSLPKGSYTVSTKLFFWNDSGGTLVSSCYLQLGNSTDLVQEETPNAQHEAISLNVVGTLNSRGKAILRCNDTRASGGVEALQIKITAIKVSRLRNVKMN